MKLTELLAVGVAGAIMLAPGAVLSGQDKGPRQTSKAEAAEQTGAGDSAQAKRPQAPSYASEVGKKFTRASTNLARSVTEFYFQPVEAKRETGRSISMIWPGLGEAFGMFLTRIFGGAIEGATCMAPFPNGWQPLLNE